MVFNSKIDLPPKTVTLPFLPNTLFNVLQKSRFLGALESQEAFRDLQEGHMAARFFWNRILFASKVEKGGGGGGGGKAEFVLPKYPTKSPQTCW